MALTKQNVAINFSQGLDTKTDPNQVPIGKFLELENSIFLKGGLLNKRNGYGPLLALPDTTSQEISVFKTNLNALGTTLKTLSVPSGQWIEQGSLNPISLSTVPVIKNNTSQTQVDAAVAPNGMGCVVYTDQDPTNLSNSVYKYVVLDTNTSQNIVQPQVITEADEALGTPRIFLTNSYFIIIYTNLVSTTYHLKYFAISISNPFVVSATQNISISYTPSSRVAFDASFDPFSGNLYVAWNGDSGSGIKMAYINASLNVSSTVIVDNAHIGKIFSVSTDGTGQFIYVSYSTDIAPASGSVYVTTVNPFLVIISTNLVQATSANNIASVGVGTQAFILIEEPGATSPFALQKVNGYLLVNPSTVTGPFLIYNSVGLASKAFFINGDVYVLVTYASSYQSTYFLVRVTHSLSYTGGADIVAKLAYGNGEGLLTLGLPGISMTAKNGQSQDDPQTVTLPYLFKDLITPVNKNTDVPAGSQVNGIYAQLGINLVNFNFTPGTLSNVEIGNNLNIASGLLYGYDGFQITEQEFSIWPEPIALTSLADIVLTGTVSDVTTPTIMTSVSPSPITEGVVAGMNITGTGIPANTTVVSFTSTTITMSQAATSAHSAGTYTFTGDIVADGTAVYFYEITYEWSDNQGNIFRSAPSIPVSITPATGHTSIVIDFPYLTLTDKITNPVKIVIYRWSTNQQIYYQTTSVFMPILNDPTSFTGSFTDINSDATILGNSILYTTGGVLENIAPPAFNDIFIFDDRLWGIDAEDPNLLWFSKQVLQSTPVEMSDLLTVYVNPNVGAQGPTGPILCGAPMDDKLILFKSSAINYISGTGPDNTGANNQYTQPIFITSTVGCSNPKSIVFQPGGLMFEFQSPSGNQIWILGRDLQSQYIGAAVERFTQSATVLSSVNVPGTNQVRFTMSSGITLMYDYYYGQWGSFTHIPAISSCIYQGVQTYLNSFGQTFQETPGVYLDNSSPVLMSFKTSWVNFMGLNGYQRCYYLTLLGTYSSPHFINVGLSYDYNPQIISQTVISPINFSPYYGQDLTYGSGTPYGGSNQLEAWRVFMSQQRCQSIQLTVNEIYDPVYGVPAAAGFTLSGINFVIGGKATYRPYKASSSVGAS